MQTRRFALIDRDGTINVEKHYLSDPDQLELYPGVGEALARLQQAGWGICVLTNQSGIARGYFNYFTLEAIHDRLRQLLKPFGVVIDGIYVCPHGPDDDCLCRKPLPGMVRQAEEHFGFDPAQAVMIGDKEVDVEMGQAVGAKTFLVRTGHGQKAADKGSKADHVVADLVEAVDVILG